MSPPPRGLFHFFLGGICYVRISPPWLGCSSLERWKPIKYSILLQMALFSLVCEDGGGETTTTQTLSEGGGTFCSGKQYYSLMTMRLTLGDLSTMTRRQSLLFCLDFN
jgi:hypothetical protein